MNHYAIILAELEEKVVITPESISEYYERNYDRFFLNFGSKKGSENMNEFIIKHLRKENAEAAYNDWIKKLRKVNIRPTLFFKKH